MPNELPPKDLKSVWQSQNVEEIQMSIDEIRTRARDFERKIRRRNLREYLAAAVIAAAFVWFAWQGSWSTIIRVGYLSVAAGALCFVYDLHRRGSSRTKPKELGMVGCLDFHLGQLERQRNLLDQSWKWMIWLVPGLVVLMMGALATTPIRKAAPFLIVAILWTATWFWMMLKRNKRKARALQQEIDELSVWGKPLL
jgi:drug/metabolite transporter (DMT)-like permease